MLQWNINNRESCKYVQFVYALLSRMHARCSSAYRAESDRTTTSANKVSCFPGYIRRNHGEDCLFKNYKLQRRPLSVAWCLALQTSIGLACVSLYEKSPFCIPRCVASLLHFYIYVGPVAVADNVFQPVSRTCSLSQLTRATEDRYIVAFVIFLSPSIVPFRTIYQNSQEIYRLLSYPCARTWFGKR